MIKLIRSKQNRQDLDDTSYIELKDIKKQFGKHLILNDLNLKVDKDVILGIIGSSGSGKSTILKLLIGFYRPTKGKIYFRGKNIYKDMNEVKKTFGFATEDNSFYRRLTVKENLCYFGSLYNIPSKLIKKRANELMKLVGLEEAENTLGENLSIGMQRRLDIICALIHNPKVLILDEPTEDLDPILRKQLIGVIQKIRRNGTTVILTSHLLHEVGDVCDKIAILHNKRIIEVKSPDELKTEYQTNSLDMVFRAVIERKEYLKKGKKKEIKKSFKEKIKSTNRKPLLPFKIRIERAGVKKENETGKSNK